MDTDINSIENTANKEEVVVLDYGLEIFGTGTLEDPYNFGVIRFRPEILQESFMCNKELFPNGDTKYFRFRYYDHQGQVHLKEIWGAAIIESKQKLNVQVIESVDIYEYRENHREA